MSSKIIEVTIQVAVSGCVDQDLLDHLGSLSEGSFKEMYGLGELTPNDSRIIGCYEETELELVGVTSELVDPNEVLLVDQTEIPASFGGMSLFLNGTHILDSDEINTYPIFEVAEALAKNQEVPVQQVKLSEKDLALHIAKQRNSLKELYAVINEDEDLSPWLQGYTNQDAFEASKEMLNLQEESITPADPATSLLLCLIKDIQATGGLVSFTDGMHAPLVDPGWVDLGERIAEANNYLTGQGIETGLIINTEECSSKEFEEAQS